MSVYQHSKLLQKNFFQDWIGFICIIGMLFGFVASRAVLSISMIVLFLNVFWPMQFKHIIKTWRKDRFAMLALIYFFINFIGGLWSKKQDVWFDITLMHLPFLTLPLGMLTVPLHKKNFRRLFLVVFYAIAFGAIATSLFLFFKDIDIYMGDTPYYWQIPNIKEDDHIRFSLFLVLGLIPGLAYIQNEWKQETDRRFKFFLIAALLIIIVYLHILSAKTGLVTLYMMLGLFAFKYFYDKGHKWKAILLPPIIIIGSFILSYFLFATVQNKVGYVIYEFEMIFSGLPLDYQYSEAGRLISYQVAFHEFKEHMLIGTGTGDVMKTMREGYAVLYPQIPSNNQLIPHNQYIYTLLAFGFLFIPFFLALQIVPFQAQLNKYQVYLNFSMFILLFAFLFEAMLQVQLGIFVYLFYITIWNKWNQGV